MRKYNLLKDLPKSKIKRVANTKTRTIKERIISSYRDKNLYDGNRKYGYGGFKYDGRWIPVAKRIFKKYKLKKNARILQIGCEKGFLLHDIKLLYPNSEVYGIEVSNYAVNNSMKSIKKNIKIGSFTEINYQDSYFDFVIAIGVVYSLNLRDAIRSLKEIVRVSKNKSFINLASYSTPKEYWMFKNWTLLGSTILLENEWLEVLKHTRYNSDYYFTNSKTLALVSK